jgi:vitamin-K-epoxide reductase (warfarin-sensitive)
VTSATVSSDPTAPRIRFLFVLIAILALAGAIVSGISLQRHYAKSATEFCDLSQKFSCDVVNRSAYSSIKGIPVAGIGLAGYAVLFVLSAFRRERRETPTQLFAAAGAGLAFALYLTYIEAYVLETWCILCLISLALILLIAALASVARMRGSNT